MTGQTLLNEQTLQPVQALVWAGDRLRVLDQRQLPERCRYDDCHDAAGVAEAIATMRVRGAPAIGIAAAYAVVLSARRHWAPDGPDWRRRVADDMAVLAASRPTAVNLFAALAKMRAVLAGERCGVGELLACAQAIHADDLAANRRMGDMGAELLLGSQGVLTHCNTGALATGGYGTALGVIRSCWRRQPLNIYAGETRPWLQGARLTAWELAQEGIAVTLIADSAAAWLMRSGAVDWVVVGADRIAANGDTANKIGTYALAVLARQHRIRFMVVAPTTTIDWTLADGGGITIERRAPGELLPACYGEGGAVGAWNPVFDVTPADLIDVIVTERGVVRNPGRGGVGVKELCDG